MGEYNDAWVKEIEFQSEERFHLQGLNDWLTKELFTGLFVFGGFFFPAGLVALVLGVAAVLFTPYMLWKLGKAQKTGWIVAFAILVLVPAATILIPDKPFLAQPFLVGYVFVAFYAFCATLRVATANWLIDLKGIEQMERAEARRAAAKQEAALEVEHMMDDPQ